MVRPMFKDFNRKKVSIFFYLLIAQLSVILFCIGGVGIFSYFLGANLLERDANQLNSALPAIQHQKQLLFFQIGLVMLVCGILAILAAFFIARKMAEILKRFAVKLQDLARAKENFTQRLDTASSIKEIASAEDSFNQLRDYDWNALQSVSRLTDGLSELTGKLLTTSQYVSTGVQQVSEVMTGVNQGAESQSEKTSHLAEVVQNISISSVEAATTATDAQKVSLHSKQAAEDGQVTVKDTLSLLIQIEHFAGKLKDLSNDLNARSEQIRRILDILIYISRQTKILALNANIEAAKAGEAGRGFAVVAQQIRDLADNSQDSIGDIAERIGEVREALAETVSLVGSFYELVEKGGSKIMEAESHLVAIQESSDSSLSLVNRLSELVATQSSPIEEVSSLAQNLAEASKQFRLSSHSVAETVNNQAGAMGEFLAHVKDIQQTLDELQRLIMDCKLS